MAFDAIQRSRHPGSIGVGAAVPRPARSHAYASRTPGLESAQGLLPARAGAPLAERMSHPLDDKRRFMTSSHLQSPATSRAWSHWNSFYVAAVVKPCCVFFLSFIFGRSPPSPRAIFRRPLMPRTRIFNAFLRGQVQIQSLLVNSVPRLRGERQPETYDRKELALTSFA